MVSPANATSTAPPACDGNVDSRGMSQKCTASLHLTWTWGHGAFHDPQEQRRLFFHLGGGESLMFMVQLSGTEDIVHFH